jgi:hypothetical protein
VRHAAYLYYPNDELVLYIAIIAPNNKVRFFTEAGTEACCTAVPLEKALHNGRFVQLGVTNRRSQCSKFDMAGERDPLPPESMVQPYFDPSGNDGLGCWRGHEPADKRNGHQRNGHMKKALILLATALACLGVNAANTNLVWNPSAGATSYRVYASVGTAAFAPILDLTGNTASVPVAVSAVTRFYVTALNSVGESGPSNTVTNNPVPVPSGPVITMVAPGLSTTNVEMGASVNITALIQNTGDADFVAVDGALTLLPPGATRDSGPYIHVAIVSPPLVVSAKSSAAITGTWTATPGTATGIYTAYMVVKSSAGVWTASPYSYFTVTLAPAPSVPPAPTDLRITPVTQTRLDLRWVGTMTASTEVERNEENTSFKRVATVAPGIQNVSDSIRRRRNYAYRVRQRNSFGTGPYSNVAEYAAP